MCFNSALVSTFLLASAALAGYHPEKQQPPLLNHVEKSINSTIVIPLNQWTGSTWLKITDFAAGTFTAPMANGPIIGSGFDIAVGVSGLECNKIILGVGITVIVDGSGGVSYQAWGQWHPSAKIIAPDWFAIFTGDEIGAVVQMSSSHGFGVVGLINFRTQRVWATLVTGEPFTCQRDAGWVVATLPQWAYRPIPSFHSVTFSHIEVHTDGNYKVPDHTDITTHNMEEHGRVVTSVMAYEAFVIITYITEA